MSLTISRILHAGYIFECEGTTIAFDPVFENPFSRNCYAFPSVRFDRQQIRGLRLNAVFISHFHDDHCSLESLDLLDRSTPIYVYCLYAELFTMIAELGFEHVYPLEIDHPILIGTLSVTPRRALDADVDSMFQIQTGDLNVLNVVDSWLDPTDLDKLAQFSPWDLVLWPFQTMRELEVITPSRASPPSDRLPREWIEQLKVLNPRYVVPSSCQFVHEEWSWYNRALFPVSYKQFQREVEAALPHTHVVRLNPSVGVVLDKLSLRKSASLAWVEPLGEQNVDYAFSMDSTPMPTAEISKRLSALDAQQTATVIEFCQSGLATKYSALEPSAEIYFHQSRLWRLTLYDHAGQRTDFHYRITGSQIELVAEREQPLGWTTELPIAKLYEALVRGETLTSMYVRINDLIFTPDIERAMAGVDCVEDPLIRCLFSGVFGAYQRNQLQILKAGDPLRS